MESIKRKPRYFSGNYSPERGVFQLFLSTPCLLLMEKQVELGYEYGKDIEGWKCLKYIQQIGDHHLYEYTLSPQTMGDFFSSLSALMNIVYIEELSTIAENSDQGLLVRLLDGGHISTRINGWPQSTTATIKVALNAMRDAYERLLPNQELLIRSFGIEIEKSSKIFSFTVPGDSCGLDYSNNRVNWLILEPHNVDHIEQAIALLVGLFVLLDEDFEEELRLGISNLPRMQRKSIRYLQHAGWGFVSLYENDVIMGFGPHELFIRPDGSQSKK